MNHRDPSKVTKRIAGAVACALAVPLFLSAFSGAGATVGDPGDDPKVVLPPVCTTGTIRWNATGTPAAIMANWGMSGTGVTERVVPGMTVPAGHVTVVQLVGFDANEGRADAPAQHHEQVRVAFYKNGQLVTSSYATDDLRDHVTSAWWTGGLGTFELPNGADEVRVVHSAVFDGSSGDNGMAATGVCLATDAPPTTTVPPTTTPPTTTPPTTTPPTTTPPTTTPPTTTPPTTVPPTTAPPTTVAPTTSVTVMGQQLTRTTDTEVLAYTGKRSVFQAIAGGLLLICGLRLVRNSKRRLARM